MEKSDLALGASVTNETSLRAIGLDIAKAVEFMKTVNSETQIFLKDVERQLERCGMRSVSQGVIYLDSRVNIDTPQAWLQVNLGRVFSAGAHTSAANELVVVEVHLEPSKNHDEPFVLLAVVRSTQARQPSEWTSAYANSEWLTDLLPSNYVPGSSFEAGPLDGRVFKGLLRARVMTWSLTRMTSSAAIQNTIVEAVKAMRQS